MDTNINSAQSPADFFLLIADKIDGKDDWQEDQFKSVDRIITKCEKLANLCKVRGYSEVS